MNLKTTQITSENFEQVLQALVDDSGDPTLSDITVQMRKYRHNDDQHHNGEDVLTHTRWVLEDLAGLTQGMDAERKTVLSLAAMLHDVGKAYTHAIIDGRNTFRLHSEKSCQIVEVLLSKHRENLGPIYQRVMDLIRLHDALMILIVGRTRAVGPHYLYKFLREPLYTEGHLNDLVVLSMADSRRAKRYEVSLAAAEEVLRDIAEVARQREMDATAGARRQQALLSRLPEVQAILAEVPAALAVLPDLPALNEVLGKAKLYDLCRKIREITG